MYERQKQIQIIVDEIDSYIENYQDEALTLRTLSQKLGYSEYHTTGKFKEISDMKLREYLRQRKLALALKEVRDSEKSILKVALDYGFSSHETFTGAFRAAYGRTPSAYQKQPSPVVLRIKISPFDRYLLGLDELGKTNSTKAVKTYFVAIPARKFLFIENRGSSDYWDFWQKQNQIPGQDMDTVCELPDSIKGKLDDDGGSDINSGSSRIMAYRNDRNGRLCDWGYLRTECYGVRFPIRYVGDIPHDIQLLDIAGTEHLIFEHGPLDYEQENQSVEYRMEDAVIAFNFASTGYCFDDTPSRILYFYFQPERYWKYIRPMKKRMQ